MSIEKIVDHEGQEYDVEFGPLGVTIMDANGLHVATMSYNYAAKELVKHILGGTQKKD